MSVIAGTVLVGTTATVLFKNSSKTNQNVTFTTHGNAADVYVGGSNVTSSTNGVVLAKSLIYSMWVPAGEVLYCAGNGADTVKYLAFGD